MKRQKKDANNFISINNIMDAYGLGRELSEGNMVNSAISQRNAEIDRNNSHLQANYNLALKNLPKEKKSKDKVADIMEGIGGASVVKGVLGGTKDAVMAGQAFGKIGEKGKALRRQKFLSQSDPEPIQSDNLESAGSNSERRTQFLEGSEQEPMLTKQSQGVKSIEQTGEDATKVAEVGEDTIKSVSNLSKGLDAFNKASNALNIGMGAYDAFEDFSKGKIQGNNINEKISNVSQIASGGADALGVLAKPVGMAVDYGAEAMGFEEAGAMLDATGVGASVGLALNAIGAGIGIFGAVEGIVGESKEKKQISKQTVAPPQQQQRQAVQDTSAQQLKGTQQGLGVVS